MKRITKKQIEQRIIDWGLDLESEEDWYTARESLYYEDGKEPKESIYDDGIL